MNEFVFFSYVNFSFLITEQRERDTLTFVSSSFYLLIVVTVPFFPLWCDESLISLVPTLLLGPSPKLS